MDYNTAGSIGRQERRMSACGSAAVRQPTYAAEAVRMADANINPLTGLSTDYLNHFNEAIMLLEMVPQAPECAADFYAWEPMTYSEHFAAGRLKGRETAIEAYETCDPDLRESLDTLANTMTVILVAIRDAMQAGMPADESDRLARRALDWLKPLVARAGAVINGAQETMTAHVPINPQEAVDALMRR
jgi:hypothetical protein